LPCAGPLPSEPSFQPPQSVEVAKSPVDATPLKPVPASPLDFMKTPSEPTIKLPDNPSSKLSDLGKYPANPAAFKPLSPFPQTHDFPKPYVDPSYKPVSDVKSSDPTHFKPLTPEPGKSPSEPLPMSPQAQRRQTTPTPKPNSPNPSRHPVPPGLIQATKNHLYLLIDGLRTVQNFPEKSQPEFRLAIVSATKPLTNIKALIATFSSPIPVVRRLEDLLKQLMIQATNFLRAAIPGSKFSSPQHTSFSAVVATTKEIVKLTTVLEHRSDSGVGT